jgi:hypothetical protein
VKSIKMLGLAALAALMAMAVGASSAMAETTRCAPATAPGVESPTSTKNQLARRSC